jgi:hypothetical protein
MPRKSSPDLFSVSAAAEALSRSRRTVSRALKNVKPDAVQSGLAKWSMKKIISAIDANTEAPINNQRSMSNEVSELDRETRAAFDVFDKAFEAMLKAKPLSKRRELAHKLGPLLAEARQIMKERDTADGLHPEHVELRSGRIYSIILKTIENCCDWEGTTHGFNILNPSAEAEAV